MNQERKGDNYVFTIYSASLFSASMALIFSRTRFMSSLSFCTLRFISSMRELPFLDETFRKPRLFS